MLDLSFSASLGHIFQLHGKDFSCSTCTRDAYVDAQFRPVVRKCQDHVVAKAVEAELLPFRESGDWEGALQVS